MVDPATLAGYERASLAWARRSGASHVSGRARLRRILLRGAGLALRALPGEQPDSPHRVLVLQPDHIGDVLLASPALALLADACSPSSLTYVVGPWSEDVARHGPLGKQVRTLPYPGFTRAAAANPLAAYCLLLGEAASLRRQRYGLALVLRPDHWWGALLAAVAGIPVRVGYAHPDASPFLTHTLAPSPAPAPERALALARRAVGLLGGSATAASPRSPVFDVTDEERQEAERVLGRERMGSRPLVAVQPTAGAPLKSWPVEAWVDLAHGLGQQGMRVMLTGASEDGPLLRKIQAQVHPAPSVLAGLPLGVLAALLARCQLVLGLDSGPLHLASAVGSPTLRLYGPASPFVYGPWPPSPEHVVLLTSRLACAPCGHLAEPPCGFTAYPPCLLALSVPHVLERAVSLVRSHQDRAH